MIRVGIVGAGIIGKEHIKAVLKNSECELSVICDISEEKAAVLAEGTNAKICTDYREMADREITDAVILNLPHYLHKDASLYFLEKGIPVLVEKPMANSVSECYAMEEASKKYGTPLAVGHVQRYRKCFGEIKDIIASGRLGRLCAVSETRNTDYFHNRPDWFLNKAQAGGGITMNYAAHTFDKIFCSTGLKVEEIHAMGNNFLTGDNIEATAQMLVRFSDGVSGTFTYCGCVVPYTEVTDFYFTNGVAEVRAGGELWISEGGAPLSKFDLPHEGKSIFDLQLEEFIKLIRGQDSGIALPEYGKSIIAVLESALRQMEI